MKVVTKPWGKEIWLELNDSYCYKRIYINAGHQTSFQYHKKKLETNYIIEGEAVIWLENDQGVITKTKMTKEKMRNTFNCGIGMVIVLSSEEVEKIPVDSIHLGEIV